MIKLPRLRGLLRTVWPARVKVGLTPEEEQAARAFLARQGGAGQGSAGEASGRASGGHPPRTSTPAPAPPRPRLRWFIPLPVAGKPEAQLQCLLTDAVGVQYWAGVPVEREKPSEAVDR